MDIQLELECSQMTREELGDWLSQMQVNWQKVESLIGPARIKCISFPTGAGIVSDYALELDIPATGLAEPMIGNIATCE